MEYYRRLAERVVGRTIVATDLPDAWWVKGASREAVTDVLEGATVSATDRRGKLLLLRLEGDRPLLGLRFGMTGRLLVDGVAAIDHLQYSPSGVDPSWVRFALALDDGERLEVIDPRRLGGVELDPDLDRLGPDAYAVTPAQLRRALETSSSPLKARLMDQSRLAGLGNLLTDEVLWRASLAPVREARSLDPAEHRRLHRHLRRTLAELTERGGSHTGDLQSSRERGGRCPRDGQPLDRRPVGGRTTYWCPAHQV